MSFSEVHHPTAWWEMRRATYSPPTSPASSPARQPNPPGPLMLQMLRLPPDPDGGSSCSVEQLHLPAKRIQKSLFKGEKSQCALKERNESHIPTKGCFLCRLSGGNKSFDSSIGSKPVEKPDWSSTKEEDRKKKTPQRQKKRRGRFSANYII